MNQSYVRTASRVAFGLLCICVSLFATTPCAPEQMPDTEPETVMITYHVQKGHENEMKQILEQAWATYRRLDMVFAQPHVVLQSSENGNANMVEIFTWKSHDIPDHMPAEVQAIWKQMHVICEMRGGKPAMEGGEVRLLVPTLNE